MHYALPLRMRICYKIVSMHINAGLSESVSVEDRIFHDSELYLQYFITLYAPDTTAISCRSESFALPTM